MQRLSLQQKLLQKLSPQQIQVIKLLELPSLMLEQRIKFDIPIPSDIKQIKDVFKKNGYKLYVVGGAVRDALLGKTPKDYDKILS